MKPPQLLSDLPPDANTDILAVGFRPWKAAIYRKIFPNARLRCFNRGLFGPRLAAAQLVRPASHVLAWGMIGGDAPRAFARRRSLPFHRVEDGFIRSIGLGARHTPPLSYCLDSRGIYFDPRTPSDLEHLLATYDFDANPALMAEAEEAMAFLIANDITKYNLRPAHRSRLAPKRGRRVLCLGQVPDDQSILCGCENPLDDLALVTLAAEENPGADLLHKPHPDVLSGARDGGAALAALQGRCTVLDDSHALSDLAPEIDRAYTQTSLGGFELLLRGVPVTALGAPFYSGWGLTDDRQATPRRGRRLTLAQVFAGAYLCYPRYVAPETFTPSTLLDTMAYIVQAR